MTDSMVERVARALMNARSGCYVNDWKEAEWNPYVEQALKEAHAAIEAMREPGLAIRKLTTFEFAEIEWPRLIDAALSEASPSKQEV